MVNSHSIFSIYIPSGKHNYGKTPCSTGKSTISMAIFNSYLDITRGYPLRRASCEAEWAMAPSCSSRSAQGSSSWWTKTDGLQQPKIFDEWEYIGFMCVYIYKYIYIWLISCFTISLMVTELTGMVLWWGDYWGGVTSFHGDFMIVGEFLVDSTINIPGKIGI
jgi:hypothetical protein